MGFTEFLTLIFARLKVLGFVSWSWWAVFSPEIIAAVLYAITAITIIITNKKN